MISECLRQFLQISEFLFEFIGLIPGRLTLAFKFCYCTLMAGEFSFHFSRNTLLKVGLRSFDISPLTIHTTARTIKLHLALLDFMFTLIELLYALRFFFGAVIFDLSQPSGSLCQFGIKLAFFILHALQKAFLLLDKLLLTLLKLA